MLQKINPRLNYLDWTRALCILSLFVYHVADYYSDSNFGLKTGKTSPVLNYIYNFFTQWRLALLMFISGTCAQIYINKYGKISFLKDKFFRICLPLILGSFILIPPQIYIERITHNDFQGSFFDFLPFAYQGTYPSGNRSWGHLWFLFYLYVYTVIFVFCVPILKKMQPTLIWLLFPILIEFSLRPFFPTFQNFFSDIANVLIYFFYFILGTFFPTGTLFRTLEQNLKILLLVTIPLCILFPLISPLKNSLPYYYNVLFALRTACCVLTIMLLAKKYLDFNHRYLDYLRSASYPFYILHHTVIIIIAYFLLPHLNPIIFLITTTIISFFITWSMYEMIKPWAPGKILLGMQRTHRHKLK